MARSWRGGLAAGSLALLSASVVASSPVSAATPIPITFEPPSLVDPIHTFGEPDIGVDPQGRVFASGPTGTGTQRSVWYGSVDNGHSFRLINPGPPPSAIAGQTDAPGGGDTDIAFDRGGRQYFADLYALTCLRTAVTPNGGATVAEEIYPAGCSGVPGADRQWLAVYDPAPGTPRQSAYNGPTPLVYMEYNNLVNGAQWVKSLDGLTYVGAPLDPPTYAPFGADGYPAIDQVTGKVFQAAGVGNALFLNIGTPSASGDLSFLDAPTAAAPGGDQSKLIRIAGNLKGSPDTLFSVLSMDSARNLFVTFAISSDRPADRQVFVSAASAGTGWTRWSPPVQVSQSPSNVNVFPWIKAGGPGRADAVWYGTDTVADPSANANQAWNVYMNQLVFPVDSAGHVTGAAPFTAMARVSPHPNHYQSICLAGTGCIASQGNRNLADFFVVTIDPSGAAEVVYPDTSNRLVQNGFTPDNQQLVDHAGAPLVTVARQNGGLGLYGRPVSGRTAAPVAGIDDAAGDARYPVIGGGNQAGFDLLGTRMALNGPTLTIQQRIADLSHPATTISAVPGATNAQYVTRWQMGDTIYYAAMETTAAGQPTFYAGKARSVDLCSVSACFPHVITYPEVAFGGSPETGRIDCPTAPSAASPCLLTITVNAADVGSPSGSSLLESVGSYAFALTLPSGAITNPSAQVDNVPLEVDGSCCFNFSAAASGAFTGCQQQTGHGRYPGGDYSFTAGRGCRDGGQVRFTSGGRTFVSSSVDSITYNAQTLTLVMSGEGLDSGQTVTYVATFVQSGAGSQPALAAVALSDGQSMGGNALDEALHYTSR